jgi:hypothetical protein
VTPAPRRPPAEGVDVERPEVARARERVGRAPPLGDEGGALAGPERGGRREARGDPGAALVATLLRRRPEPNLAARAHPTVQREIAGPLDPGLDLEPAVVAQRRDRPRAFDGPERARGDSQPPPPDEPVSALEQPRPRDRRPFDDRFDLREIARVPRPR